MRPSAEHWGTTQAEREATYPCERYATKPYRRYLRAVDVDVDPAVLFRWVCQVKVAPYSYDWIDNRGRVDSPKMRANGWSLTHQGVRAWARLADWSSPGR